MTSNSPASLARPVRTAVVAAAAGLLALLTTPAAASAAPAGELQGWRRWWLPHNYSVHGEQIDLLFTVIFVVTLGVGVAVLYYMVKFCVKYRHRPTVSKAHFTHGNKRLEMIWTIVPAVLLLGLALWTKGAWDDYRYSPTSKDPNRAQLMVVAEQFNWNVIYPGGDGKIGRYLVYPKTTDLKWPAMPPGEDPGYFAQYGSPGPAYLPQARAVEAINGYISTVNPLGKDFADEAGRDDDWVKYPGRPIHLPKGRPVEIHLSSKDVLHSFALPDYRVKLDAVPGMKGLIYLTATTTSAEFEDASKRTYTLDELEKLVGVPINAPDVRIVVPADAAAAGNYVYVSEREVTKTVRGKRQKVKEKTDVQVNNGDAVTPELLAGLRAKGALTRVEAYTAKAWDLVCEELCGSGHTSMRGRVIVLDPGEYAKRFESKGATPPPGPATAPTASVGAP